MFGKPRSDVELLEASLRGSAQAFEAVVSEYQSLVCAITYSATRDRDKSEELAQEVFLLAWKSLDQLQDLRKFRAWLCSIARNTVQNRFRRQSRDVVDRAVPLTVAAEQVSGEPGPAEVAVGKEEEMLVSQALAQIPDTLREPLILFYREHQSIKHVARQLGLSNSAARQRISRGRAMLREQVAAMVERTITHTRPGKAFTVAVAASLASVALKGPSVATAATQLGVTVGMSGITAALSSATAKLVAVAAGLAIVAGSIIAYRQLTEPAESTRFSSPTPDGVAQQSFAENPATLMIRPVNTATDGASAADPTETGRADAIAKTGRPRELAEPVAQVVPFEFKPKGVLSGLVTDADTGRPVVGATLAVAPNLSSGATYEAATDANGFYHFEKPHEPGSYTVSVESREYVGIQPDQRTPGVYLDADTHAVRHFQLHKACMVELWIVDSKGTPIKDAQVCLASTSNLSNEIHIVPSSPRADSNGYLLVGGIPPADSNYAVGIWHETTMPLVRPDGTTRTLRSFDYARARLELRLSDPNVITQAQVALQNGQSVRGYAAYADGVPATDVGVSAYPQNWPGFRLFVSWPVAVDGTFTLEHIVPGSYDVNIEYQQPGGTVSYFLLRGQPLPLHDEETLVLALPGNSPVSVSGTVTFAGGPKPPTVSLYAYAPGLRDSWSRIRRTVPDDSPELFVIEGLEPGKYRVTFSGAGIETKVLDDVETPSKNLQVELTCTGPTAQTMVAGIVVDGQTEQPIPRFTARIREMRSLDPSVSSTLDEWSSVADERGMFALDMHHAGIYQVQIRAEGYAPVWSRPVRTDGPDPVTVVLTAGGTIAGHIRDEQGRPLSGARIIPLSIASGASERSRDRFVCEDGAVESLDGAFTLSHVTPGTETLKIIHAGYTPAIVKNIPVFEGRSTDDVEVALTAGGTVEGCVYDGSGKPQRGQQLHLQSEGYNSDEKKAGRLASTVSDANGFYRFEHVPDQLCYVVREDYGSQGTVAQRAVVPTSDTVTRLDLGGKPIVTGVIVVDGQPLARSPLTLRAPGEEQPRSFYASAMTDERGAFTFRGVAPGTYAIDCLRLLVWKSRSVRTSAITIGSTDVDLGTIVIPSFQLNASLDVSDANTLHNISRLYLKSPMGERDGASVAGDKGRWTIDHVEPGDYLLVADRYDRIQWSKSVHLEAGKDPWHVSWDMPTATAAVSGHIVGPLPDDLMFWRDDKAISGRVPPVGLDSFSIANLPAGNYLVGSTISYVGDGPAAARFSLLEGEKKEVDLDLSIRRDGTMAYLNVIIVDENGIPRTDASLRLEGTSKSFTPVQSADIGDVFLVPPGRYAMSVQLPGYRTARRELDLNPCATLDPKPQNLIVRLGR